MDPKKAAALSRFKSPLVNQWMLAEITGANDGVSGGGREQVTVRFSPVVNNIPQNDLTISGYIQRSQDDDDPATLSKVRKRGFPFLRAVDPEFPTFPKRQGKGVYEVQTAITVEDGTTFEAGQQVDYKEYSKIAAAVDEKTFEALDTLGDNVEDLIGLRVYIKPGRATYSDEWGVSQFINSYASELRDGTEPAEDVIDHEQEQKILAELGLVDG